MLTKRQMLLGLAAGVAGASIPRGGLGAMLTRADRNGAEAMHYHTPGNERMSVAQSLGGVQVDLTVNVPSDFATLQSAIDALSNRPVRRAAKIIINIESGHTPASGISVSNGDYGHFWIQSVDDEVSLDATWADDSTVIYGDNARLPVLDCLINAGSKGQVGIWANNGSTVYVPGARGIKNMGNALSGLSYAGTGLRIAHGSTAAIGQTVFSGAGANGLIASQGALVMASAADFSNAGTYALFLSRGAIFHGHDCVLSGAGDTAVRAGRSYASVRGSNCQNAGNYGIWAFEGSTVAARGANCSGAGIDGVHCFQGSAVVDISAGTVSTCMGDGVVALDGSKVIVEGSTISGNAGRQVYAEYGSTVSGRSAIIDGSAGSTQGAVLIAGGSQGSFTSATITGNPSGNSVRVEDGSHADLASSTITGGALDISLARGSIVSAFGVTTSTSGTSGNTPDSSDTDPSIFNAISPSGILFA